MGLKGFLFFCLTGFVSISSYADVTLPKIFGDSMVLQRERQIPIWGWATRNESITVQFQNQRKTTRAGADGTWRINLDAVQAGGPYTLTVKGKNAISFKDVLVGEVWICSGQSNMEWPVSASDSATKEIASAQWPMIRHIKVQNDVGAQPKKDVVKVTGWNSATAGNIGSFTAVGYYFARKLYQELQIPIGLINTSWGGTDVETWTSREAFENHPAFKDMMAQVPTLNMDSMALSRKAASAALLTKLQGGLPDAARLQAFRENVIGTGVPTMNLPGMWEQQGLPDIDGVVWFKKTIELTADEAANDAVLHLAMADDQDETFVNGKSVGKTNGWNNLRVYKIGSGILKAGRNDILIRVEDSGGGGGIHGEPGDLKLALPTKTISLAGPWHFIAETANSNAVSINPNSYPTLLYNAMIHPLIPYGIRGAIWYQGESNAGRAYEYRESFPLMIKDWRSRWKQGDFPFYFVQLATFDANKGNSARGSNWAELREAQTSTLSLPNTGMAVTTDIGDPKDIHPRNKQDVGKRLAAIALAKDYGRNGVYSGPIYDTHSREENKIVVNFKSIGSGLIAKDKYGYLKGFEIAGEDQKFLFAKAEIQGNSIIVHHNDISNPVAVRYLWADDAGEGNLYNAEGFPASPFRTDKWKGVTEGVKYKR